MLTLGIHAQNDNAPAPHMFVSLQGGATYTYTHSALDRKWAPMGALSFGGYFTNVIGARLQANGWMWKQDYVNYKDNKQSYFGANADLLVNLTNIFSGDRSHLFEVVALGGLGMHENNIDHEDFVSANSFEKVKGDIWSLNLRGGAQLGMNLSRALQLQLEGGVHKIIDGGNPSDISKKWWPYVMAGLSYNFAYKKNYKTAPVATDMVADTYENTQASEATAQLMIEEEKPEPEQPKPQPKPQPQPAPQPVKIGKNIFFDLGKSAIRADQTTNLDEIANFAKENPGTKFTLVGYADAETGTDAVNDRLSKDRANAVKAALVKRGVEASRISTEWKGSSVQPFPKNDDNRVVIVVGESK